MTVIAGYVDQEAGVVHLAADSAGVAGNGVVISKDKLYRLGVGLEGEQVVFGAAGFAALGPLVCRHVKSADAPDASDADVWAQAIAEAITGVAVDHLLIDGDDDGRADMAILMAWRDRLWTVSHHLAIPIPTYMAVGSGAAVAMGAMWAMTRAASTLAEPDRPAALIPESAVAAAIAHMDGIAGPVQTARTEAAA